jgi:hypothetical protein
MCRFQCPVCQTNWQESITGQRHVATKDIPNNRFYHGLHQRYLRPERASTCQPRATPWEHETFMMLALKGQNKT